MEVTTYTTPFTNEDLIDLKEILIELHLRGELSKQEGFWHNRVITHQRLLEKIHSNTALLVADYFDQLAKKYHATIDSHVYCVWTEGMEQEVHTDQYHENTNRSLILYINDDFKGGETCFENNLVIPPKEGQIVSFNGGSIKHSVNKVRGLYRITSACWMR